MKSIIFHLPPQDFDLNFRLIFQISLNATVDIFLKERNQYQITS